MDPEKTPAAAETPQVFEVELTAKDGDGKKVKKFPSDRAIALLKIKNSQWTLTDKGFKFDGKEISKADDAPTEDAAAKPETAKQAAEPAKK